MHHTFWRRSRTLFLSWSSVGLAYGLSAVLTQKTPLLIPTTTLDQWVAWQPLWLWVYLSFFALVPFVFYRLPMTSVKALQQGFYSIALISFIVFVFFPSTITYPETTIHTTWHQTLWHLLHQSDYRTQCLPSLHASISTLCAWAYCHQAPSQTHKTLMLTWWLVMLYSILACKRHLFIDTAMGTVLGGIVCVFVCLPKAFLKGNTT